MNRSLVRGANTKEKETVDFSCVKVVYKAKNGSWRGFVDPYDISIEAESKAEAIDALEDMLDTYEEVLEKYDHPAHLKNRRLTNDEDHDKFIQLVHKILRSSDPIQADGLYVETKKAI